MGAVFGISSVRPSPSTEAFYPRGMAGSSGPPPPNLRTLSLSDENDGLAAEVAETVRRKYRPALTVMSGESVGTRVTVQGNLFIGRDPKAELVLPDPGVSWRHAMLEDRGGAWVVVDLGSTNGVAINGRKEPAAELRHGDKLKFGTTLVRFEVQDETDEAYSEFVAQLIHIDDLTGLYLRRRFDAELGQLLTTAAVGRTSVGLLAMDLDGVKGINDQHGHLFGAYTISEAGKLVGEIVKGRGIACRFGGDEFIAALPKHDIAAAREVAEEIRTRVASHVFEREGVVLKPGMSVGVAAYPALPSKPDATELFRYADEALYLAKRTGKNRVCVATELPK